MKTKKLIKLKGGSLIYTIFIMLLFLLITCSFLTYYYVNNKQLKMQIQLHKMEDYLYSAINYYRTYPEEFSYNATKECNILTNVEDGFYISINKKAWGLFDIVEWNLKWKNIIKKNVALIGVMPKNTESLIIKQGSRFEFAGGLINGNIYVPKAEIKLSNIALNGSEKPNLTGSVLDVNIFEEEMDSQRLSMTLNNQSLSDSIIDYSKISVNEKIYNSFQNNTLIIQMDSQCTLYQEIDGNIIIRSDHKITIGRGAKISEAIIISPEITVEQGVVLNAQLIATKSIKIENNVSVLYPGAIAVIAKETENVPFIEIGEDVNVKGTVLLISENDKSSILIKSSSIIDGEVYSNQYCEIYGEVKGRVFAGKLLYITSSTAYENFFSGKSLDIKKRNKNFRRIIPFSKDNTEDIIKWLE